MKSVWIKLYHVLHRHGLEKLFERLITLGRFGLPVPQPVRVRK